MDASYFNSLILNFFKMKSLYFILGVVIISVFSCGSSKSSATPAEIEALTTLIEKRNFRIECDNAYPTASIAMQKAARLLPAGSSASVVSLIGNSNYLVISGDSITSFLPYYGERQMSAGYGGDDSAIQFKGTLKNYKVVERKNNSYDISFEAKSFSENFRVTITMFTNLKSDIVVNGSSRSQIRYSGNVKHVDK